MWEYPYAEAASILGAEQVKVVGIDVPGGDTRTQSVINGLASVDHDTDGTADHVAPLLRQFLAQTEQYPSSF